MSSDDHCPTTPVARSDVTDTAVAGYLFVFLGRYAQDPRQEDALRALPRVDWMLKPPGSASGFTRARWARDRPSVRQGPRQLCNGDFKQWKQ